ncbi:probable WRKY transcription factor 2 [Mercurialis annua]|uniref:probable WRKY transcription factor 2 n=1 Tax=Mercurialis annua TaxID=3986 RepID=UPI0021606B68|nr:probable WRKY transcription factor 2 [Mercurialis annua]XP_050237780.1 probable WRKY transcription factor 2 [Mercurialis annua]XP_050237781.1 probable WRKY transcription factor 2 [Mercurialis annua]
MSGIDDNVAIIGDWVPPRSNQRTFFSAIGGDDNSSKTTPESSRENKTEELFLGSREQATTGNNGKKDGAQNYGAQFTELTTYSEQKSSSRGGLVERMAARAGFNAPRLNTESIKSADLSLNPEIRSPYLTIPPGLSPTTLLDSPVFLSNYLAQPSPTTGKFSFVLNGNSKGSMLMSEPSDKNKENFFEDINDSSFAFKPIPDSASGFFLAPTSKQSFPSIEVSVQSENSLHGAEPAKVQSQHRNNSLQTMRSDRRVFDNVGGSAEHSPPLDEHQDEVGDQRASGDSVAGGGGGTPSEDGYNWRKYGQKQVKGSEYPRSYYKCTHPNCLVKKKVERSHEGHITEIIYKGAHNHPKPTLNRRSAIGSSNPLVDMQLDVPEQAGLQRGTENDPIWASALSKNAAGTPDWRHDNIEVTSSASVAPEFGNPSSAVQAQNAANGEAGDAVDASSTFSNDEDEDDRATHGSVGYDGEGDESESKRRKIETTYPTEIAGATRAIREPRVVVQTTSEVDILDDGYRWRKYGQKVVKGNPNPRSYYKCTNAGCTVRKHVERASHDLKSVITTYEGKHNHDVPAARNSSHANSASNAIHSQAGAAVLHRPEPSQVHNGMSRFDRSAAYGNFSHHGRQQMGHIPNFSFGMHPPGLANLAMAGLGPGQPKMPVMSVHPYLAHHQRPMNEMGYMLPKGEPKVEPMSEPSLNLSNNPSVYQQIMNRLPLGPHM